MTVYVPYFLSILLLDIHSIENIPRQLNEQTLDRIAEDKNTTQIHIQNKKDN